MQILILGGTGFIGAALGRKLAEKHDVAIHHRGSRKSENVFWNREIIGDISTIHNYHKEIAEMHIDVLVDMVSRTSKEAEKILQVLSGTIERAILVSSGSVYQKFGVLMKTEIGAIDNRPTKENSPLRTSLYPYRNTFPRYLNDPKSWLQYYDKIPIEHAYLTQNSLKTNVVRLPLVYGEADTDNRIDYYVQKLQASETLTIPRVTADWINSRAYVDNVAYALEKVIENGQEKEIYNVSGPEDYTEYQWITLIGEAMKWKGKLLLDETNQTPFQPLDDIWPGAEFAQHLRLSSTKIRQKLGYAELMNTKEAVFKTVQANVKNRAY